MSYAGSLNVSFLSDWHCGIGAGKHGGVDRTIALDEEGFPCVPGRTLKGLWRDGCERVAHALDDGQSGEWTRLVRALFGDPVLSVQGGDASRGLVHVRDGRLTAAWRERLLGDEADLLVSGLRVARASVAISDETGTARPDHLRLIEFARGGLDLGAPFSVEAPKNWAVELVLSAGLQEVTVLGARRRRGAGRCILATDALRAAAEIAAERESDIANWRLDSIALRSQQPTLASTPDPLPRTDLVRAGRVLLTVRQPVVVTRAVLGNLMLSHDFVPGSTLLPLVARVLGPRTSALIRAGQLVVTDAVPSPETTRLARTPLSLVSGEKGSGWVENSDDVHDARYGVRDFSDRPVGGWSLCRAGGAWRVARPSLITTAHASIDDAKQRTLENGVYTLQAIAVDTRLAFDVWLPADMTDALASLPEEAAIGRYRQDSYGLVKVELIPPADDNVLEDMAAESSVSFWLTSDSLIEQVPGVPDTTPDGFAKVLEERLAEHGVQTSLTVETERTFVAVARRDSWNGSLSLPRSTLVGLSAGSVITVHTTASISGTLLRRILDQGLGERRAEGFGRCEVLPLGDSPTIAPWSSDPTPPPSFAGVPQAAPHQWEELRRAIWRTEIQQRIVAAASKANVREQFFPSSVSASNLGSLRTAAMALPLDPGAVDRWLEGTEEHDVRGQAWSGVAVALKRHFGETSLRQANALHKWLSKDKAASARELPPDLGGNSPTKVASWLLVECVRRQAQAMKTSARRES